MKFSGNVPIPKRTSSSSAVRTMTAAAAAAAALMVNPFDSGWHLYGT